MGTETQRMRAAWRRQFGPTLAAYALAAAAAWWAASALAPGAARTVVTLLPVVPGLALLGLTIRIYRRADEYVRLRIVQAAAVAGTVTVGWTLVYAYLELAGVPPMSLGWVSNVAWAVFAGLMLRFIRAER